VIVHKDVKCLLRNFFSQWTTTSLGRHDFHVPPPLDFFQAIMDAPKGEAQVIFGPQ
jgi:hypothetical protein